MTTITPVWLTPEAHDRLIRELAVLRGWGAVGAEDDDSAEPDSNTVAIRRAQQGRIQQIHDMLASAVVGVDPPNDGVAELGMVLTVRFEDTGETDTFLLGVRGAYYGDIEVYSAKSPLGEAISGARPGDRREYQLPTGRTQVVTLVSAVPYGLHMR
ncbi:GreA/GreB family elongation factor [Mycolicibacterium fluoranthenivorans]|jgi:transcription elongation GreA/GreB family factor|uniref:GreA/GreB family elongation factor n=1 Tax=Mycolicibacterium fluoranthenivorans TaxID=258505 RepID=A0A1G4V9G7_9MYCO|nr:GreA/GreB family elongation factor [Mycolicibacterium fluoranthenivorans]QNJ91418.1 GreA/GreB family elongation factor [Mycolicibacterium fluoranthenivorans]SCX03250.1 Transcription elongation factor, GreA/GreB family [Mycolicibacterium fluoranthenivorans]